MMGRVNLVYFSPVRQALNAEIASHAGLQEYLKKHPTTEFEVRLAEIARYCGVMLDGEYDQQDIDNICGLCLEELRKKSTIVLLH
jgi:hypothetical protein